MESKRLSRLVHFLSSFVSNLNLLQLSNEFGGIEGLCSKLAVDPVNGLPKNPKLLQERRQKYGANVIPKSKPKPFWKLVVDASKDPTLLILICSGFISLGLSFYEPETNVIDVLPTVITEIINFDGKNDTIPVVSSTVTSFGKL